MKLRGSSALKAVHVVAPRTVVHCLLVMAARGDCNEEVMTGHLPVAVDV
jgi:hypothetical protein